MLYFVALRNGYRNKPTALTDTFEINRNRYLTS